MTDYSTSMRTDRCGDLRADDVDRSVTLCGWVDRRREHVDWRREHLERCQYLDRRCQHLLVDLVVHVRESLQFDQLELFR